MTFHEKVWAVTGNRASAEFARLMLRSATRNGNGISEIGDLRVTQTESASSSVIIKDGAGVARGREALWQGSYEFYNIGDQVVPIPANTSGSVAYRLIVARVEDPTFAGSPWTGNPADQIVFPRVLTSGINENTKDLPSGMTGIPLALITMPAGTSQVTNAMITDRRQMLDARVTTEQFSLTGSWTEPDSVGNTTAWEEWPSGLNFSIAVPDWAAQAVISWNVYGGQYRNSGGQGGSTEDARGRTRAKLGAQITDSESWYWVRGGIQDYTRTDVGGAGQLDITQAMRGTNQSLVLQGRAESSTSGKGKIEADGGTTVAMSVTFREKPRYDVPDRSPS